MLILGKYIFVGLVFFYRILVLFDGCNKYLSVKLEIVYVVVLLLRFVKFWIFWYIKEKEYCIKEL